MSAWLNPLGQMILCTNGKGAVDEYCPCPDCRRTCPGFDDLVCAQDLFVEISGVTMADTIYNNGAVDTGASGYDTPLLFFRSDFGTELIDVPPRYHSNKSHIWGKSKNYLPDPDVLVCTLTGRLHGPYANYLDCDGNDFVLNESEQTGEYGVDYFRYITTQFIYTFRLLQNGDVDVTGTTIMYGGQTALLDTLWYGRHIWFHGSTTPPAGWIDDETGLITSKITISNDLTCGEISNLFDMSDIGFYPTTGHDQIINLVHSGGAGQITLGPDTTGWPSDWETNASYKMGSITCTGDTAPGCPGGYEPPDGPPDTEVPPPPWPPWLPPRDDPDESYWMQVRECGTQDPTGDWIRVDETPGKYFKSDGECLEVFGEPVVAKRSPGPILFPTEFYDSCESCELPPCDNPTKSGPCCFSEGTTISIVPGTLTNSGSANDTRDAVAASYASVPTTTGVFQEQTGVLFWDTGWSDIAQVGSVRAQSKVQIAHDGSGWSFSVIARNATAPTDPTGNGASVINGDDAGDCCSASFTTETSGGYTLTAPYSLEVQNNGCCYDSPNCVRGEVDCSSGDCEGEPA